MKIKKAFVATAIFISLLLTFYMIHIKLFRVNVVFYDALYDGLLASFVATGMLIKLHYFSIFNVFEKIQMSIIWLLAGYVFAISGPTVIDRSLSFYILEKLQQRGGGIQLENFEEIFTKEYVKEHRLMDVRLTEQQASGTIVIQNGCVKLTERGKKMVRFSRFFRKNLLPRQRLLMGEYSDNLTDPFRHKGKIPDYQCD